MLNFRQRLLTTTLLVGASALPTQAFAQDAAPATSGTSADTQSTVPDQNTATNAGGAPPTGDVSGQPAPTRNASGAPVQSGGDIIITGSRIPQPNLTSAAPVTVLTNQDVKLQGTTRIEDVLNSLPSVQAAQSSGISNGATGTAQVDLRDLGPKRTLVLINGRRLVPGDPATVTQAADLNFIPSSLVKRVDVLTGGASSVYGADAVAGVVNFIMDTGFTGIRFDGQYSFYQHGNDCPGITNGRTVCDALNARQAQGLAGYEYPKGSVVDGGAFDGTVSIGAAFDDNRGHAMGYFGYRKVNAVLQQRRDYSACGLQEGKTPRDPTCGGSAISNTGNAFLFDSDITAGTSTSFTFGPQRTLVNGQTLYNFNPTNYYQRPDERYTGGVFADYEITPAIHPYMEFMFMDDHTLAQIAPSGDFGNTYVLNCDNPFMSAQARDVVCSPENTINGFLGTFPLAQGAAYNPNPGADPVTFFDGRGNQYNEGYFNLLRRNVEGGPRISDLTHTEWRGVVGTRGELSKVWSYDAYFQYGRTNYEQVYRNEFSVSRLNRALNVVNVDANGSTINPATGQLYPLGAPGTTVECRSVLDGTDPTCVPYDLFGTPSPAAVNYLNIYGVITGTTSEQVADANITGDLGQMGVQTPWSDEGVGINIGTEYRKESLSLNPDQSFQTGDLAGQGGATLPVNGAFRVLEGFGEVQLPIIRHSFIEEFSLAAGYRKSWYETMPGPGTVEPNGDPVLGRKYSTDTYKLSVELAPIHDVRFRGAYNRAVRAPNIQELFAPQAVALDGATDPCAGHKIAATEYGCLAQGLVVGQNTPLNPAAQYNGLLGGNPDLNPEKATTKTLGVVLQPRWVPRLAFTVDWYDIKIDEAIQTYGADAILTNCINNSTATVVAPSCALINRNPAGSLWLTPTGFVTDLAHNVGGVQTSGLDFNGSYSYRFGSLGTLSASFIGTRLIKYIVDDGLNQSYDCAGFYGPTCGNPIPKWRSKARATMQFSNGIGVSLQWRMVGKVAHEGNSSNPVLNAVTPQLSSHISAQNYFDLAGTFNVGDHYNLRMGVNNILDRTPPLVDSSFGSCPPTVCNGNTFPGVYDTLGRYFFAAATLNF
jgi:outer membrane receptor protein involved in Fe transport